MSILNNYTTVELGENRFRIAAFTPATGLYLSAKIALVASPLLSGILGGEDKEIDFSEIVKLFDRPLYDEVMNACTGVMEVELPSGWVPLFNKNGSSVTEVSMFTLLKLLIETLKFNFKDFFGELLPLMSGIVDALPQAGSSNMSNAE